MVKRIESCHSFNFCMERRAVVLRRDLRAGFFKEVPFGCCAVSQPNSSRAWLGESFLTFFTASSTVLMLDTLAGKLLSSKQVFCAPLAFGFMSRVYLPGFPGFGGGRFNLLWRIP